MNNIDGIIYKTKIMISSLTDGFSRLLPNVKSLCPFTVSNLINVAINTQGFGTYLLQGSVNSIYECSWRQKPHSLES